MKLYLKKQLEKYNKTYPLAKKKSVDIGKKIWTRTNEKAIKANMNKFMNGTRKSISALEMSVFCYELECEPNDLLKL